MENTDETAEWLTREMREIRRRVREIPGCSVNKVMLRAGIHFSTWWRWEQYTLGKPGGQVAGMERIARVKSALAELEAEAGTEAGAERDSDPAS
jgi:hypothetical protein